jgi:hypothetical protein
MPKASHGADLLIDGRLVPASDGGTFDNVNPATEEVIGVTADGTAADMDLAIRAARRAFDETGWSTDLGFRVRCLRQLQEALTKNAEELRSAIVAEIGTPVTLTRGPQLDAPVEGIGWVADLAEGYEWTSDLGEAAPFGRRTHRWVQREPAGVVGAITGRRLHHRAQARAGQPVDRDAARPDRRPGDRPAARGAQHRSLVPARIGSAARRGLTGGYGLVHRINRDRSHGDDGGRGQPQEGVP